MKTILLILCLLLLGCKQSEAEDKATQDKLSQDMRPRVRINALNVMHVGRPGVHVMAVPSYTPANAPGIAMWFNADDVTTATSTTWTPRVGNFQGLNDSSYARKFDTTYSAGLKGAVFENDVIMRIRRPDGSPIYSTTPYPVNAWFASVMSVNGSSGSTGHIFSTENGSTDLHARFRLTGKTGTHWSLASSAGNGSAWNDLQINSSALSSGQNSQPLNTHAVFVWQLGSAGTLRINGVAYDFDLSLGAKNHLPSGNTSASNILLGKRWNNTEGIHMNVRHLLHGAAVLTLSDIQKLEGALAHDSNIQASLPLDHPYRTVKP